MQIITDLEYRLSASAVTLGKFDGIHLGHRMLLDKILSRRDLLPVVFTFAQDSQTGVLPAQQIYSQQEKDFILRQMGIAAEILFPFRETTRNMSSEQFLRDVLIRNIQARYICVGEDFRFGKDRQGDVRFLQERAKQYGYELEILPKREASDAVISSSRIRSLLERGEIHAVNELLGDLYFIQGTVVHGQELGQRIGIPTANQIPDAGKLLPLFGVYATWVWIGDRKYKGVTNVGVKPTVGSYQPNVETHLIDYEGDLYGQEIRVCFHDFLRGEQKFTDVHALAAQMERDKQRAANLL